MIPKAVFNWSGGKDSALALYTVLNEKQYAVSCLLTSVNTTHNRVSMHGVRRGLLVQQAVALNLPLEILEIPGEISMQEYDALMKQKVSALKEKGITHSVFGDLFLEDLRAYREAKLNEAGITAVFPLWKKDTMETVREFIRLGFKAITVCVDAKLLDASFAGRVIDEKFLADLPEHVDPCGENGEFHSFVFDGPIFSKPIAFEIGEKIYRETKNSENPSWNTAFWYCDLLEKE